MRLDFIGNVKENEVLGKTVFDNDGRILLRAGIKLTSQYISKLTQLGAYYIYIEDDRLGDIEADDPKFNMLKQDTMRCLNEVIKNVGVINKSNTKDCLVRVNELIEYILELGDINKSLLDIKTHNNYTLLHSVDTGIMATFMGVALGLKKQELNDLAVGGVLHDIGKVKISPSIIDKKGPLSFEEFEEMKRHPIYGKEILMKNFNISRASIKAIEQHHEKIDGKGYPYGLKDKQISNYAKIVCVCDVYDAVSNNRSYRKKLLPNEAYELILAGSGTNFDKKIVNLFRRVFSVYPLGCCVKLSNDIEGYVIKQNENFPDRPVIRVLYDHESKLPIRFYEINLLEHRNLIIKSLV